MRRGREWRCHFSSRLAKDEEARPRPSSWPCFRMSRSLFLCTCCCCYRGIWVFGKDPFSLTGLDSQQLSGMCTPLLLLLTQLQLVILSTLVNSYSFSFSFSIHLQLYTPLHPRSQTLFGIHTRNLQSFFPLGEEDQTLASSSRFHPPVHEHLVHG